jgi:hypothetical protein
VGGLYTPFGYAVKVAPPNEEGQKLMKLFLHFGAALSKKMTRHGMVQLFVVPFSFLFSSFLLFSSHSLSSFSLS